MAKKEAANGQKIHKRIRRKMHVWFLVLLFVFLAFTVIAAVSDLNVDFREMLYCSMPFSEEFRGVISENIEEFYDILITVSTILAATVIFFYSVQDNRKEGIPHRAIMAYSFGSYTIPVFFFFSMVILPTGFWLFHCNMKITFMVCMIFSFLFQMLIIALILFSTSFTYGLRVICKAEVRQYKMLCKIETGSGKGLEDNPQFIWTYLMHHLEQAVTSDELIADKMMLVRELLKTPYHKSRCPNFKWRKKNIAYVDDMSSVCLEKNKLNRIYEFYYGNLSAAMEYLGKTENSSERNKIYLVLYEFLDNLQKLYDKVKASGGKETEEAGRNYMMTVSGLMNAVLDSEAPDAEAFCNYVLNNSIKDDEIRAGQIGLYFLSQEYLYRTSIEGRNGRKIIPAQYLNQIRDVAGWAMKQEYQGVYFEFWQIWMDWTTISERRCIDYFRNAITAMEGKRYHSSLAGDLIQLIRKTGKSTYENQSHSVDE